MIDHLGNPIQLDGIPKRIVSLVPSQTELVVDLGMRKNLVGLTKFCVHPKGLKNEINIVGGTKQIHFDRIRALQPDLILCNKEENTPEMVEELKKVSAVHVSDVTTIADAYRLILDYGTIFNNIEKAQKLVCTIQKGFQELKPYQNKNSLKVAYFIWKKPWMVAANHNFIHSMINELGFSNAFAHLDRYPEVDLQNLPLLDWVFLSSEPFPFKEKDFSAFTNKRIKLEIVDGECFSWYGSRMIKSISYFKKLLQKMNW